LQSSIITPTDTNFF